MHRYRRFSLRTLVVVMTALTVWIGLTAHRANRQRYAVECIRRQGGQFWYDYQVVEAANSASGYRQIDPDRPVPGPEWLRGLLHEHYFITPIYLSISDSRVSENNELELELLRDLDELEEISFSRLALDDADVAQLPALPKLRRLSIDPSTRERDNRIADFRFLRGFPQLEEFIASFSKFGDDDAQYLSAATELRLLWLGSTQVGDDGLQHLQHLTKIESLNLANTKVTDAGLARLKSFESLQYLSLNSTAITDEGLKHLRSLPKLEALYLINTTITDAGLMHLASIRSLKRVEVIGARITDEVVAEFLRALPSSRVRVNWGN